MAVSFSVLLSVSFLMAAVLALLGTFLGLVVLGWVYRGIVVLAQLPGVAEITSAPRHSSWRSPPS